MLSKWMFLLFVTVVMSELSGDIKIRKSYHVNIDRAALTHFVRTFAFRLCRLFAATSMLDRRERPWSRWASSERSPTWAGCCFRYERPLVDEHASYFSLVQQYNETTSAFGRIRDILNDQFSDTATKGVSRRRQWQLSRAILLIALLLLSATISIDNRRKWRDHDGEVPDLESWVWADRKQEFPGTPKAVQTWSCWCQKCELITYIGFNVRLFDRSILAIAIHQGRIQATAQRSNQATGRNLH